MQKYKRPRKYKHRSIPLRNPRVVLFPENWDSRPSQGIDFRSFSESCTWYVYDINGVAHRVTCEPATKPKYIRIKLEKAYVERRMYFHARVYWFKDVYKYNKVVFESRKYTRDAAYALCNTELIFWLGHYPFAGDDTD